MFTSHSCLTWTCDFCLQSPVRYDSFDSLSLTIPSAQLVRSIFKHYSLGLTEYDLWSFVLHLTAWLAVTNVYVLMSLGSNHHVRPVSATFHLLRNHQRSGMCKLYKGIFKRIIAYTLICESDLFLSKIGLIGWFHYITVFFSRWKQQSLWMVILGKVRGQLSLSNWNLAR